MMHRAFLAAWAASVLVLVALTFDKVAPALEQAISPILTDQAVGELDRQHGLLLIGGRIYPVSRLCWDWGRTKNRPTEVYAPDIDVLVDTPTEHASTTITNEETGAAWARSGAVPQGQAPAQRWCTILPPGTLDSDPVQVHQVAKYLGWRGLWMVPVSLPDVVDRPGTSPP